MDSGVVPTPPPDPGPILVAGAELVAIGIVFAIAAWALVWGMIRVSKSEPSTLVTVVLGLLTLVALGAAMVTGSEALTTIAATGVGALAGAVSNVYQSRKHGQHVDDREPEPDERPDEEQPER